MSDCDLDCDLDGCCDCDCDCDCDCLDGDCCGDCGFYNFNFYRCGNYFSCCNFNCFETGGDSWLFFSNSSGSNRNSDPSCCCCCWGGGGGVASPPRRTVKTEPEPKPKPKPMPKPKKRSRVKRMLMFWKTYSENDQEQKAEEKQLDDMSGEQACHHKSDPPHKHGIKQEEEAAPTITNINHGPPNQWPKKIPMIGRGEEPMMKPIRGYRGTWLP